MTSSAPVIELQRGIRVMSTCFSPDERYVAFTALQVGAMWLCCFDLETGKACFETRIHLHSSSIAWTAGGHVLSFAEHAPLRLEARAPSGEVVQTFAVPDGAYDVHHLIFVNAARDRVFVTTQERKDDRRYEHGAPGYAWVLDGESLAVRHHVDMREHYPPDGRLQSVQNVAAPHPTRDDVAFRSYASSGENTRYSIEVVPASGPPAKAEAPPCGLVWLDENRLLLYPFDKTELEPLVAPASAPSETKPIGEWFPPRYVLGIDHASARVLWHCPGADGIRSTCPDVMPRTRTERELPKVLRKLNDHARCLDPASATTNALFVLAKNGRTKATDSAPAQSRTSFTLVDAATGATRDVFSISRLRPQKMMTYHPTLEVHASPRGRFVAVVAQEEAKRFLRGYIAVVER